MALSRLHGAVDRAAKMIASPAILNLLTGLQLFGFVGLVCYSLYRDKLSSAAGSALLVILSLGEMVCVLITQWLAAQRSLNLSAESQQAEDSLRQNEAKIRRLIEANLIGVYVANFNGTIFEANDAFLEMVGYTRDDLQAGRMNWKEMTPSQYVQIDQQALEEQRTTGVCTPFEKEYFRKDGGCASVLFGCAVFDEERQRTIGFALDLTQRKQAEAALRQSEAKFRRLIEANLIGVSIAELDGLIFEANDAFLNIVGYTREDLYAGQLNWAKMTPPEYFEVDRQATEELRTTGTFTPFEKEYYRKDGSRVPILLGHAVFDQGQQISIGFVLNLSDRKRAEAASVLEERNRIAREIHDTLAQAFTSIIVHLDVACRKLESNPAIAQSCIQTSYELAQSGLDEARRSVAALRPHYLEHGDLYNALCLLARQIFAHSSIQFVFKQEGEAYLLPEAVESDLFRIGQEALMNAYKHAKATEIEVRMKYEPTQCVLQVKDNGLGFTAGSAPNDSGFGLLGMTERAERSKGHLTIQSAPGEGTNVIIVVNWE